MLKLRYFVATGVCFGAFVLLSAFGETKMTLAEQMKKVDAVVAENVASFEANKRAECKAMALQKAIGIAETKLAVEASTATKTTPAITKKGKTTPKAAPKVTPKGAPDQKTRTGASNSSTPAEQKTRTGASTTTSDPAAQKVRGGATKTQNN